MHNQAGCGKEPSGKKETDLQINCMENYRNPSTLPGQGFQSLVFFPLVNFYFLLCGVCISVCACGSQRKTLGILLYLSPLRKNLLLNLELGWRPPSSSDSLDSSALPSAGLQVIPASPVLCMGTRDSNSGPHGNTANVLTHGGAISPPLSIDFLCSFL